MDISVVWAPSMMSRWIASAFMLLLAALSALAALELAEFSVYTTLLT